MGQSSTIRHYYLMKFSGASHFVAFRRKSARSRHLASLAKRRATDSKSLLRHFEIRPNSLNTLYLYLATYNKIHHQKTSVIPEANKPNPTKKLDNLGLRLYWVAMIEAVTIGGMAASNTETLPIKPPSASIK
ncbi:MAG: hypothetical protein ACI85I_000095 [Arenicella sp.]|jgi:hypothetical protein